MPQKTRGVLKYWVILLILSMCQPNRALRFFGWANRFSIMVEFRKWLEEKLITPARTLDGNKVGFSAAVGFWGGIFPIPAMSTLATLGMTSVIFRSHFNPAMTTIALSINLAATPIQLFLLPFFMGMRSYLVVDGTCSVSDLFQSMKTNPILETGASFGVCLLWAVAFWVLLAPPALFVLRQAIQSILAIKMNRT